MNKRALGGGNQKETIASIVKGALGKYENIVIRRTERYGFLVWGTDLPIVERKPALKGEHQERET